jgi:hypothetical protein
VRRTFQTVSRSGILGSPYPGCCIAEVLEARGWLLKAAEPRSGTPHLGVLDRYALGCIAREYTQGRAMGWRGEVRELIAQLEEQRSRLEQVKLRAQRQGGPEGERLEAQAEARLRDIEERIKGLRDALEE